MMMVLSSNSGSNFLLVAVVVVFFVLLVEDVSSWSLGHTTTMRRTTRLNMISTLGPANSNVNKIGLASDEFLKENFHTDIDDFNIPPSLSIISKNLQQLCSGSDIRGQYVATPSTAKGPRAYSSLAHTIGQSTLPALTPFAAHCLGYAFGKMVQEQKQKAAAAVENLDTTTPTVVCIGRDPREHGVILADSFARGAGGVPNVKVVYTGLATTPALFEFCR
jgi:hypothetical protein